MWFMQIFARPKRIHDPRTGCTQFNPPFDGLLSSLSCSHQSLRWWNTSYSFMRKNTNPLFQLLKHVISANIFAKQTNKLCMYLIDGSSKYFFENKTNPCYVLRSSYIYVLNNFLEFSKLQCHSVLFHNSIAFVSYFFKFMIVELNQNTFEICWLLCQFQKKKLKKNIFSIVKVFT